jgi:hypothetical protein
VNDVLGSDEEEEDSPTAKHYASSANMSSDFHSSGVDSAPPSPQVSLKHRKGQHAARAAREPREPQREVAPTMQGNQAEQEEQHEEQHEEQQDEEQEEEQKEMKQQSNPFEQQAPKPRRKRRKR